MKNFSRIIYSLISFIIIILPLIILILRFFYTKQYILIVNDNNKNDIISILNYDDLNVNNNNINRIELSKIIMSRYSRLNIILNNGEKIEYGIKNENCNYAIVNYLKENAINIEKILTLLNYISIIPMILIIFYCIKIKKV